MCTLLVAAVATALSMTASAGPGGSGGLGDSANPEITIVADPKGGYDVRSDEKSIEAIYPNVRPRRTDTMVCAFQAGLGMDSGSLISGDLARHYSPVLGKLSPT